MHISVLLSAFLFTVPYFEVFGERDPMKCKLDSSTFLVDRHATPRRIRRQGHQTVLGNFPVLPRIGKGSIIGFYSALVELAKEVETWENEGDFQLSQVFGFYMILNIISDMPIIAMLTNVILENAINGTIPSESTTSALTTTSIPVVSAEALLETTTNPPTTTVTTTSPPSTTTQSNASLTNNIVDELLDFF
ncbi:uncharacterized protein LOC143257658 [Tachypleus tridentatus]|uniref:uncharacterized protein LOC143257658 n=1 Tax=Tachypleus tridentatus TaxID=6853 RepID=UPI003FD68F02